MNISTRPVGDVTVLEIPHDALMVSNARPFARRIAHILKATPKPVLDLRRVHYLDSAGIGALLACLREQLQRGSDLKLCNLSGPALAMFELVRMNAVFEVLDSLENAVDAFGSN